VIPIPRANYRIRSPQVRVIGSDGQQLGILATREAQKLAEQEELDLVEISPNARPPVCRVMDLGKHKYEQAKNVRKARKKQHSTTLKEMRYRPKIERHDVDFKTRHVREFLEAGHKVKVYVEFRGREMAHIEYGSRVLSHIEELLQDVGLPEARPKMEGRHMTMLFVPKRAAASKPKPRPTTADGSVPSGAEIEQEPVPEADQDAEVMAAQVEPESEAASPPS